MASTALDLIEEAAKDRMRSGATLAHLVDKSLWKKWRGSWMRVKTLCGTQGLLNKTVRDKRYTTGFCYNIEPTCEACILIDFADRGKDD